MSESNIINGNFKKILKDIQSIESDTLIFLVDLLQPKTIGINSDNKINFFIHINLTKKLL